MKRKQFLLLLALLMTAATGAWAQDAKHRITATLNFSSQTKQKTLDVTLTYETTIGEVYTAITGGAPEGLSLSAAEVTSGTNIIIGAFNEWNTPVNVTADGNATVSFTATLPGNNLNGTITLSVASLYAVKLADGTEDAGNWKATVGQGADQELPALVLKGDAVTLNYTGRLKVKSVTATTDAWMGDLSSIPASALEADGQTLIVDNGATLKGELDVSTIPYKVVIPAGATVTLAGLSLEGNHVNDDAHRHAGITCLGDATIILADNSENTVKGFHEIYPGIYVPAGSTLTIQGGTAGNGKLIASSNGNAAGIGGGWYPASCGDIEILGGDITATGGRFSAGIGAGYSAKCGDITISGGTVTATGGQFGAGIGSGTGSGSVCGAITISGGTVKANGGQNGAGIGSGNGVSCGFITISGGTVEATGDGYAAGIGSGLNGTCGDINITDGVTSVTATKGSTYSTHSIGVGGSSVGQSSTCGTVTIGGTVYWQDNAAVGDGATYLAQNTFEFVNLAKLSGNYVATNGTTLFGRLAGNYKISIADGSTVTLDGVTINGVDNNNYKWAGINCEGDATIVLKDGSENTVKGFHTVYPGIYVPEGKTLIIQGGTAGNGKLTASSNGYAAGIGGGQDISCGNIRIEGGVITATGSVNSAGIGGGLLSNCGDITIASTVTKVTATKGPSAPYSIGAGVDGNCGTVTIGGTKYWENNAAVSTDTDNYLKQATITYVP